MRQAKAKLQRKILRQELKAKLEEERVTIMPEIKTLKDAVLNLKPCFECFGLTFFKTKDVVSFYNMLKAWIGDAPGKNARKRVSFFARMLGRKLEKTSLESKMAPEAAHTITEKDIADDVERKQ